MEPPIILSTGLASGGFFGVCLQYQDYHRRYFVRDLELTFRVHPPAETRAMARFPNRIVSKLPGPVRAHFCLSMFGLSLARGVLDRHSPPAFQGFCAALELPEDTRALLSIHSIGWLSLALDEDWTSPERLQGEASNALHEMARDLKSHWPGSGSFTSALEGCLWMRGHLHSPEFALEGPMRALAPLLQAARRRLFHSMDHLFHFTRIVRHDLCRNCAEGVFREWRGWPGQTPIPKLAETSGKHCACCGAAEKVEPDRIVFWPVGPVLGNPDHYILRIDSETRPDSRLSRPYRKVQVVNQAEPVARTYFPG